MASARVARLIAVSLLLGTAAAQHTITVTAEEIATYGDGTDKPPPQTAPPQTAPPPGPAPPAVEDNSYQAWNLYVNAAEVPHGLAQAEAARVSHDVYAAQIAGTAARDKAREAARVQRELVLRLRAQQSQRRVRSCTLLQPTLDKAPTPPLQQRRGCTTRCRRSRACCRLRACRRSGRHARQGTGSSRATVPRRRHRPRGRLGSRCSQHPPACAHNSLLSFSS